MSCFTHVPYCIRLLISTRQRSSLSTCECPSLVASRECHALSAMIITIHRLRNGFKEANKCVKVTVKTVMKDPENSEGEVN